jgi:hypothetical protein
MKWLQSLLSKFGPKRLEHPTFGALLFMKMPDPEDSYWEGGGVFGPTGREIEYFVDGDENGPHPGAEEFYREVQSRYPDLISAVRPLLAKEFERWVGRPLPVRFEEEFLLSSLSVPGPRRKPVEWEMSFDCVSNEHLFSVRLRGWSPDGTTVDG